MTDGWTDFRAPPDGNPFRERGELRRERYPTVDGAATPPGWSVTEWITDFENTPFYEEYLNHREKGMELTILLSDYHAMRGTGKTTLSIKLARAFDATDEGLTPEKVTNSPEEFIDAYVRHAQGSGLVFDEAEAGIGARDAMTTVNKEMNEKVSMGRVGEKYAVWNMPDIGQIDKQIKKLGHYWVLVQRRGRARVYELSNNPFQDETYTKPICNIEWSALPASDPVYQRLDEHKWDKLTGDGEEYVPINEVQDRVEKTEEQAQRETRDRFIYEIYEQDLLTQQEISELECVDVSQRQVSEIVNSFDETGAVA
jgi:hypothetical protein